MASDSTAFRVIDSIDQAGLERVRAAVGVARERAWALGAAPKLTVLDLDATLLEAFSRKQGSRVLRRLSISGVLAASDVGGIL